MKVEDFNYNLPEELIAQTPLKDRTSSRLLVLDKNSGEIEHLKFANIIDFLDENDVFWTAPPAEWTSKKAWNGNQIQPDQSINF